MFGMALRETWFFAGSMPNGTKVNSERFRGKGVRGMQEGVYILLIRSNTLFSRFAYVMTGDPYTHASIGFAVGEDEWEWYSFARKHERIPLPAGFVKENLKVGVMKKNQEAPCALYRIQVESKVRRKLQKRLRRMYKQKDRYRYNCLGTFFCYFEKRYHRENYYFCSQFIAEILETHQIVQLSKEPSVFKPDDFRWIPDLNLCYEGHLGGLAGSLQA